MANRQVRITNIAADNTKILQLKNCKVHVILNDGSSTFGILDSVESDKLTLLNGRLKKQTFQINHIYEIYSDTTA